jgi:hypothetical protein
MTIVYSVDLISDLNLSDTDHFDWTGKPTSLFCVIAGNVSSDLVVLERTLAHLSGMYRGIFYIDGAIEHPNPVDYYETVDKIKKICSKLKGVLYLHNHIVILNDLAIVACNGWYGNGDYHPKFGEIIDHYRLEDAAYLSNSLKKLQTHDEVRKIMVLSHSMPSQLLVFRDAINSKFPEKFGPSVSLLFDEKHKVKYWLFGTDNISIDMMLNNRHFANNPAVTNIPYWPKRIEVQSDSIFT